MRRYNPSEFFWKTQNQEREKVEAVCAILNTLTPEQIEAVEFYRRDMETQREFDLGENSFP